MAAGLALRPSGTLITGIDMLKNKKSLGQNWLKDRTILDEIASLASPEAPGEVTCLEVGPGLGTLTSSLLRRFPHVIAIEIDQQLAQHLPQSFPGTNLTVIHADFLQFDLQTVPSPYVVAANIPLLHHLSYHRKTPLFS